ncbi:MAG TPA: hypothetical protein PLK98_00165, partial [Methanothrix sp.]|nr:hypothetical protein [Methanothrix sp.]
MNHRLLFLLIFFIGLPASGQNEASSDSEGVAEALPQGGVSHEASEDVAEALPQGGVSHEASEDVAEALPSGGVSEYSDVPLTLSGDVPVVPALDVQSPKGGEPRVVSSVPSGYAPATGGPLTIKKTVTPVETGKGHANRLRVDVEITSIKKNRLDDAINDIDIYELLDESLNLVPPADSLSEIVKLDYIDQLRAISRGSMYDHFFEIPLINYQKAMYLDEISLMRLALLRDIPLSSADPISYGKIYANPESKSQINYIPSVNTVYNILTCNKNMGIDNNSENLENLSKYMRENFGIKWINPSNVNISYPGCSSIQMENIRISDNNTSDNWILFMIDNHNADEGVALLNISDQMI